MKKIKKKLSRFKIIFFVVWTISAFALVFGLVFTDTAVTPIQKNISNIFVQVGGAFFFALSAGYVIERIQSAHGYSILWKFSQEFREAGLLNFFSNRDDEAEENLKEAFAKHKKGEVLMAGASLRYFLAPGHPLNEPIRKMLEKEDNSVRIRALFCSPDSNDELPIRSFVEEFSQNGTIPSGKKAKFDWGEKINFSFGNFKKNFYKEYGLKKPFQDQKLRVMTDLESTRNGIRELKGIAESSNSIEYREIKSAPYCTVIIFPDRAFYTPNLLCSIVPVNMPTLVFHKTSSVYEKLKNYFKFLWWVNDQDSEKESEGV